MKVTRTRHGLRLSQHGVVISELRTAVGPTHSVFDLLAACVQVFAPAGRIGVLGFAGGGMMAPLRQLGVEAQIESVDLDRSSYDLFCQHCPDWVPQVRWHHAEARAWLRRQPANFQLLLEDLSVPHKGDVIKPPVSWGALPGLMCQKLQPAGVAVFNLMLPPVGTWNPDLRRIAGLFRHSVIIDLEEFENRILIGGDDLPSTREMGRRLRGSLRNLGSRQAERIHLRTCDQ